MEILKVEVTLERSTC